MLVGKGLDGERAKDVILSLSCIASHESVVRAMLIRGCGCSISGFASRSGPQTTGSGVWEDSLSATTKRNIAEWSHWQDDEGHDLNLHHCTFGMISGGAQCLVKCPRRQTKENSAQKGGLVSGYFLALFVRAAPICCLNCVHFQLLLVLYRMMAVSAVSLVPNLW
jgi:hypothetical protein